jgi:hypothetical protein
VNLYINERINGITTNPNIGAYHGNTINPKIKNNIEKIFLMASNRCKKIGSKVCSFIYSPPLYRRDKPTI